MAFCDFAILKKAFLVLILIILLVVVKFLDSVADHKEKEREEIMKSQQLSKGFLKVVHLDLKGGPPKLRFLLNVLPFIRMSGANAILIEYEDMFPFSGPLKNISAENAYTLEDLTKLINMAQTLKMEVIPLVQSFGHLEYVLKLEEFRSLRESESYPQEICPLNKEAVELVKEMIRQCMALHPNANYIHLGCDEVQHIGKCPRCSGKSPKKLFADHVRKIAEFVRKEYAGVTPLIWDDMMRRWTLKDMTDSGLGSVVEPVIWVYGKEIFHVVPLFVWNIYQRVFPRIWGASAFKGASGATETVPDLNLHLGNHLAWMKILLREEEEASRFKQLTGIFLTGWSRYDHFAALCELLPVGIPSLILSLTFLDPRYNGKRLDGLYEWLRILRCPPDYVPSKKHNETFFQSRLGRCSFPGSNLYSAIIQFEKLRKKSKGVMNTVENSGWSSQYNLEKNWTSPSRLLSMFTSEGFAGEVVRKDISNWKSEYLPLLGQYFDQYTISEWEEQNIRPLEDRLIEIYENFQKLIKRKSWPKRPLR